MKGLKAGGECRRLKAAHFRWWIFPGAGIHRSFDCGGKAASAQDDNSRADPPGRKATEG